MHHGYRRCQLCRAVAPVPQPGHVRSPRPSAETRQVLSFRSAERTLTSGPKAQPKFVCIQRPAGRAAGEQPAPARRVRQIRVKRSVTLDSGHMPVLRGLGAVSPELTVSGSARPRSGTDRQVSTRR